MILPALYGDQCAMLVQKWMQRFHLRDNWWHRNRESCQVLPTGAFQAVGLTQRADTPTCVRIAEHDFGMRLLP